MEPSRKSSFVTVNGVRLHFLDWGGDGPVLLFLAGLGCNAYIYDRLAPRFCDSFRVLALTRRGHGDSDHPEGGYDIETLTEDIRQFLDALQIERAVLVGHSLAVIELSHFATLYPERVSKLVYLDVYPDRTSAAFQRRRERNPVARMQPPGLDQDYFSFDAYIAAMKRAYPSLAAIWGEVMDEHARHELDQAPDGKVIEKMSDAVNQTLFQTINQYRLEDARVTAPALSLHARSDGSSYLSKEWMTPEQRQEILDFFATEDGPWFEENMALIRRCIPQVKQVVFPNSHHYIFFTDEERVVQEMRAFLSED